MQSTSGAGPGSASTTPTTARGPGGLPGGPDDGDNRSRNAKAQRRHREKRKAHFKALEESVSFLTTQLEDARRQLSAAAYANSSRLGYSPESKDVAQLSAENAYLRDENADLRRQLYAMRVSYGREPSSAGGVSSSGTVLEMPKQEPGTGSMYGVYGSGPQSAVLSSPRAASSSHARTMSHPGDFTRAPSASPYIASAPFPTDPRAHALSTPTSAYPVRYDSAVYPAAPQHNMPRSAVSSSGPPSAGYAAPNSAVLIPREELAWGSQDPHTHPSWSSSSAPSNIGPTGPGTQMVPGATFTSSPPLGFISESSAHHHHHPPQSQSHQHEGWSAYQQPPPPPPPPSHHHQVSEPRTHTR